MKILGKYILSLFVVLASIISMSAQEMDSISISLITCTSGKDVYAKFGHTALRMKDYTTNDDYVFNYGCFNYNADNFLFKFILGQTDYLLEAEPTQHFLLRYQRMGNGVTEQVINLTQKEANELRTKLLINLQPENQEYRYKWIGNNCTDKARFMIQETLNNGIRYDFPSEEEIPTVREILHNCLEKAPWVSFGVDLVLGCEIDDASPFKIKDIKQDYIYKMFLPVRFMEAMDKAITTKLSGEKVPCVKEKKELLIASYTEEAPSFFTPTVTFAILLTLVIAISCYDYRRKKLSVWVDVVLHIVQGVAGIIIAFLLFISEHPAVSSNILVVVLNPIPLFYACYLIYCSKKKTRNILATANLAVYGLFIPIMLTGIQSFNIATYLMVLTLLTRAFVNFKQNKQKSLT